MLADSHCHLNMLDLSLYDNRLETVFERAKSNDVHYYLCVAVDLPNIPAIIDIASKHDGVYASVGVHPNEEEGRVIERDTLLHLASHPKVVAIGETGLDYFRSQGDLDWQRDRLRTHIAVAKQLKKPLIIHTRDAGEDTVKILKEEGANEVGGVMHCFVDPIDIAKKAMDLNFYISFSGIITFKNAVALQEVAKQIPLDRLLVETDCPYLAPVPFRGKPNEPGYVRYVAEKLAELHNRTYDEIADHTTRNFEKLFLKK